MESHNDSVNIKCGFYSTKGTIFKTIIEMEDIPNELGINWDLTGINYVPVSNWTMATEGSNGSKLLGWGQKTADCSIRSIIGRRLPTTTNNICWENTTLSSNYEFPEDWDITFTQNHWANEKTTEAHI